MHILHKLYIPALVVLAVVLFFAAKAWVDEREARVRAEEQSKAQQAIITQKDESIKDRDKQWQQQQTDFQKQINDIKTVSQARQVLQPILLPGAQTGVSVPQNQVSKAELPAAIQKDLPGAPTEKFSLVSDSQMIALAKREKTCQETESGLGHCNADLIDWQAKFAASQKEVETWKTAAKGGTWVHRTLKIAVPLGCAGAGAWLGSKSSKEAKRAAIGA